MGFPSLPPSPRSDVRLLSTAAASIGCAVAAQLLVSAAVLGALVYVAYHFVTKFW